MQARLAAVIVVLASGAFAATELPDPPHPSCGCDRMRAELEQPMGEVARECRPREGLRIAARICAEGPDAAARMLGSDNDAWRRWAASALQRERPCDIAGAAVRRWLDHAPEAAPDRRSSAETLLLVLACGATRSRGSIPARGLAPLPQPPAAKSWMACGYGRRTGSEPPSAVPTLLSLPLLGLLGGVLTAIGSRFRPRRRARERSWPA